MILKGRKNTFILLERISQEDQTLSWQQLLLDVQKICYQDQFKSSRTIKMVSAVDSASIIKSDKCFNFSFQG